jgi:lipoprotein-anchoring transpeptidase ErfK/SrfK
MVRKALPLQVVVSLLLAFGLVAGFVAAGAVLRDEDPVRAAPPSSSTTTTRASTTTTTLPGLIQPPPVVLPPLPLGGLVPGSTGEVVRAYEQRMADVKLDPGAVDGVFDQATAYAVQATQKLAALPRSGVIGEPEKAAFEGFRYPPPLYPEAEPNRTEINAYSQVLTLFENHQVKLVTTVSTGNGERYCYDTPFPNATTHVCEAANTPPGRYAYYSRHRGWKQGELGTIYNPMFFRGGIAVHGYTPVPAYPASHGCVRIPMHISQYFLDLVNIGDVVYVVGGAPEQVFSSTPISRTPSPPPPTPTAPPPTTATTAPPPPPPPPAP